MARPLLDTIELQQVQELETEQDQVLVQHGIPALEGDFLQRLDRRATQVTLTGVLTGAEVGEGLKTLREKFRAAQPVPFVADITTATKVDQVLIEEMGVRELAGKPARFEYAFTLREYIIPPAEQTEEPPPPEQFDEEITQDGQQQVNESIEEVAENIGTLEVEVIVEGVPNVDLSTTTVTVEGTPDNGDAPLSRTLTNPSDNVWRDESIPSGSYNARAVTGAEPVLTGTVEAVVRTGGVTRVQIVLNPSRPANVAITFVVHFRFDRAFIEPCMRPVLRQVAQYANTHRDEKLLILGHTDRVGPPQYNQSLSERRARTVYAYLTMHERTVSLTEWNAIRERRSAGEQPSIKDTWDVREYQHILQDLGFYPGAVDGKDGPLTREAVRAYRCHKGLPPGTTVDPDVWLALIEDYLSQDNLSIRADQFLPNCDNEIIKWLGGGEEDPVRNTGRAWRPNRRTELLFLRTNSLPCLVPQPDTFNLPTQGAVNTNWCAGPATGNDHCCFVAVADPQRQGVTRDSNALTRMPPEPGTFTVEGLIQRELPDGTLRPIPNQAFILTTPIGEFKTGEQSNGEPSPASTNAQGQFSFPDVPAGLYSLEIITPADHPVLVRPLDEPDARLTGNVICRELHVPSTGATNPRLDVVIVNAPVMREIRLPVAVHVMTPLNDDATIRTCTSVTGATVEQHSAHTDAEIRTFFAGANRIWRQARIRFEPVHIVREAYRHPINDPAIRGNCQVDDNEVSFVFSRCAYPAVVNVFFFGDFVGTSEAGKGVSVENARAAGGGAIPGCAIADRFQFTILGVPNDQPLSQQQSIQVLAHELGHYLNLAHTASDLSNEDRLMFPNTTLAGDNTKFLAAEVNTARSSLGASDDCIPFTLRVTGATQIGSTLSNQFIIVQNASGVVTVDADIPDRLIAPGTGTLTMTGGTPGANPKQQTVSGATTGQTEVVATYIPAGGGTPVTTRVAIHVVSFTLRVEGATQTGGADSTTFLAKRDAVQSVTVVAEMNPAPFCVPVSLVTWTNGVEQPDPLRRRVPRNTIIQVTVSAVLAGVTRSVTITIFSVSISTNVPPFETPAANVQIEGLLNSSLGSIDLTDLFDTQPNSLIRVRADIPGLAPNVGQFSAILTSNPPGAATAIETITVNLLRTTPSGDTFLSQPILAMPSAIQRSEITLKSPPDMNVIRTRAGGRIRLVVNSPIPLGNAGLVEVTIRGRIIYIFAQALANATSGITSGIRLADLQRKIARVNRIWAQAGIEVKARRLTAPVEAPVELLDVEHTDNTGISLTLEEQRLVGRVIRPGDPTRSTVSTDLNVFYVRSLDAPPAPAADPAGIAYPNDPAIVVEGLDSGGTPVSTDEALAHEIGHQIIDWGASDEHQDLTGAEWPTTNVLHRRDTGGGDVDRSQVIDILTSTNAGTNRFVLFEP